MAKCTECRHTMYEQYDGYKGHWYCFHPDFVKSKPKSIKICDVEVGADEYDVLAIVATPKICMGFSTIENERQ